MGPPTPFRDLPTDELRVGGEEHSGVLEEELLEVLVAEGHGVALLANEANGRLGREAGPHEHEDFAASCDQSNFVATLLLTAEHIGDGTKLCPKHETLLRCLVCAFRHHTFDHWVKAIEIL